jgi:hypothetical protein
MSRKKEETEMIKKSFARVAVNVFVTLAAGTICWFAGTAPIVLY